MNYMGTMDFGDTISIFGNFGGKDTKQWGIRMIMK